jgi:hypothetical protein
VQEFKLRKAEKVKIIIGDEEHLIDPPQVKHVRSMRKKLREAGDENQEDVMFEFLEGLGLSEHVTDSLLPSELERLVQFLIGSDKKK